MTWEGIHFRIDNKKKQKFYSICDYKGVKPSEVLRQWVEQFISEKQIIKEFTEGERLQGKNYADLGGKEFKANHLHIVYDESGTNYFKAVSVDAEEVCIIPAGGLKKEQIEKWTAGQIFNLPWEEVQE